MPSKLRQYPSALPAAIAANVSSFGEINFNASGKNSLLMKVASTLKLKSDTKRQTHWRYLWQSNEKLRSEVEELIDKKQNSNLEETLVSINNEKPIGSSEQLTAQDRDVETEPVMHQHQTNEIADFTSKYSVVKIIGDGNCLFRCFSHCIYGDQKFHGDFRKEIVQHVIDNWCEEVGMLHSTCEEGMYPDEVEYEKIMGSESTYGTDFEFSIFIKLYKFPAVIFRKMTEENKIIRVMHFDGETDKRTLNFLFSGERRNGHWEVLEERFEIAKLSPSNNNEFDHLNNVLTRPPTLENSISEKRIREKIHGNFDENEYPDANPCYEMPTDNKIESFDDQRKGGGNPFDYITDTESSTEEQGKISSKVEREASSNEGNFTDEDDEQLTDSSGVQNIMKKKKKHTRKRVKIFTEDLGTVEVPSTHFKSALGYNDEDKVRTVIENVMLYTLKCTCTLGFYGSVRYNLLDCVAYAKCRKPNHDQRFQFRIDKLEEPVARLTISSDKKIAIVHEKNIMAETFRVLKGEERRQWQKNVRHRSVVNFLTEIQKKINTEIKNDGHMQDLRTLKVVYKVKSHERCQERLTLQSSDLSDLMELWVQENNKKDPFLRYVSLPLTAIMFTEEDLECVPRTKPSVLHMDATGSISRKPENFQCKKIFYYCIILKHDKELLTLAHMITSEHGVDSISIFLKKYKYFVIKCGRRWPIAAVITIDWSWAFIHAILREWNLLSIQNYLNLMYEFCTNNIPPPKNIIILKTCYGHFMKRVSETIRREFPEHLNIKSFLLECVGLMAICRHIKKLDEIFKHFATILLTKNEDLANDSIMALNSMLKKKTEVISKMLEDIDDADKEYDSEDEAHSYKYSPTDNATIYSSSPFYKRYNAITVILRSEVQEKKNIGTNKYHAPRFVDYVVDTYMAYAVIWVSLDLDLVDPTISRVSNAYVETAHKVMKELVFERTTTASIADRVRQLRTARSNTMAKIILDVDVRGHAKTNPKPKYAETASNPLIQETWMRSRLYKKRKAGHLGTSKLKAKCEEITETKSRIIVTGEEQSDNNKRIEEVIEETSDYENAADYVNELDGDDKMYNTLEKEMPETEGSPNVLAAKESEPRKKIHKFYNGLIKDTNYYMASRSSTITVGMYRCDDVLSFSEFQLTAKQYGTLRDRMWIDGVVIDCFVASHIHEWSNFTYISTDDMIYIVGDCSGRRTSKNRRITKITDTTKNNLIMPYLYLGHWRLLIANTMIGKLTLMDPYENTSDLQRATEAWKQFTSYCESETSLGKLKNISWEKCCEIVDHPHQNTNDGHSCGSYVMYYMDCLGNEKSFDKSFDPTEFRSEVARKLLLKSENMEDVCLNCFGTAESNSVTCRSCKRKCHEQCIYKSQVDTDDEEAEMKKRKRKRRALGDESMGGEFLCKLCRIYDQKVH